MVRKYIDIIMEASAVEEWLEKERERVAAIPAYQEGLRHSEATFFKAVVDYVRFKYPDVVAIYLYGSRSENTAKSNSDWDILVQLPTQDRFLDAVYGAGERKVAGRKVDLQFDYNDPSGGDFEFAMKIA